MPNVAPDPKITAPSVPIAIAVVMSSVLKGIHQINSSEVEILHEPTEVDGAN
jgi:hypothetical protein